MSRIPPGNVYASVRPLPAVLRWLAIFAIILVVIFGDVPGDTRYASALQNSAHGPAFALLFLLIANWIRQIRVSTTSRALLLVALMAFVATVLLGISTEIIQWLLGRDAGVEDVLHDTLGGGSAAMFWIYWRLSHGDHAATIFARSSLLVMGMGCAGLWSLPLLTCGMAYWDRAVDFPIVGQFSKPRDLYLTEIRGYPVVLIPPTSAAGTIERPGSLEIALQGDRWPGVAMLEPEPDWSAYRTLVVEVSTPDSQAIQFNVRVDDTPEWKAENNFTGTFTCAPKTICVQSIPFDTLISPEHRRLDTRRISRVIVFHSGTLAGRHLRIHRVKLTR
jgi:VanZ family protein